MGSKYTTLSASGYNSSPPSDDGTQAAQNLVTWAKHKTKLADPVKTLADAINTALVTAFDYSVRSISASDSTIAGDHMRCIEIAPTVTTAVTVSLGDAATMTSNYRVFVKNSSARNQTLALATAADTLDGTANGTITLPPKSGVLVQTNATPNGYLISGRYGPFSDGEAIVAGGTDGTKKVRLEVDGLTASTTRVLTVRDADFDIGAATQAEQEAASITTASVTPGRQQFHPSASKAWVRFDASTGTPTIISSYNVSSITDGGAGINTINFATAFSSASYGAVFGGGSSGFATGGGVTLFNQHQFDNFATGSVILRTFTYLGSTNTVTLADFIAVSAAFYGDQ